MNGKQGDGGGAAFARGSRSYSSLPRQLPSSVHVPYGYKMDLDFVRFCDSFYDSASNQRGAASRLKRTRRSHKKSYDTLLGLRGCEKTDGQKPISPSSVQPAVRFFPSARHQTDNKLASDLERSLGQVVSDFEDTLQRSRVNGTAAYLSDSGPCRPTGRRYHSLPRSSELKFSREVGFHRTSSNSSLSDSSAAEAPPRPPPPDYAREMAETIASLRKLSREDDLDSPDRKSPASSRPQPRRSVERAPVTSQLKEKVTFTSERVPSTKLVKTMMEHTSETTRNGSQESAGAQRIRELEEQVKAIPMLKHKLSVLREEKRSMEHQLRSRARREHTLEVTSDTSEHSAKLSLRSRSLSPSGDAALPSHRVQQDASTSCRVLTRDVGVCGGPPVHEPAPREVAVPVTVRAETRDSCVGGGPEPARTRRSPPRRTVGVLTELNNVAKGEQGRRFISLESILSGRGGCRTVGTITCAEINGMNENKPPAKDSAPVLDRLQIHERESIVERQKLTRPPAGIDRGSQTRAPSQVSSSTATDPPPRTKNSYSATDPRPLMRHFGTITASTPTPLKRDAGLTTDMTLDELRSADELRMQVEELHIQLDEMRELHRSSRCSSETRDTFTQIKEYDLGVNYTRGAFAFHKSFSQGVQTESERPPARSVATQAQVAPSVEMRTFAAQVRPATASVALQCQCATESRGAQVRPDSRDVCVVAEYRRHTRSVAIATDPAPSSTTSGQVGRGSPRRHDAGTCTTTPSVVSRAVCTDKPRDILKKIKSTMTDVTPLRSIASGDHFISRHQSCQTDRPPPPDPSQPSQPAQERVASSAERESPLPPAPRPNGASRIPRLTSPSLARRASPQGPGSLTRAVSDLSAGSVSPPSAVRRSPGTISLPRAALTPPTARRAGERTAGSGLRTAGRTSATPPSTVRREKSAPVLTPPAHVTAKPTVAKSSPANKSATKTEAHSSGKSQVLTKSPVMASKASTPPPSVKTVTTSKVSLSSPAQVAALSSPRAAAHSSPQTSASPAAVSASPSRESPRKTPPHEPSTEPQRQPASAEPKQRQFGRRDTFVARPDGADTERGQGDTSERRVAPLADEDTFSSDEERMAAECRAEKAAAPPRNKVEPSVEVRAALKVLHDSLGSREAPSSAAAAATALVQAEWFRMAGTRDADPHVVEDYLDAFETVSPQVLSTVVNLTDNNKNTAMHYAVSHGNFDVVSVLLDSRVCDAQRQNAAGYTCIMLLSLAQIHSETHRQVVRRLFQSGDVNVRAKQHGQTALMLAVSHGRIDMVSLLLEAGADVNIQDEDGSTSLMCASEHGHAAIVRMLLAHPDCDTQLTDNDGCTALQVAMEAGHRDVGLLLYAHSNFSRGSSPYGSLRMKRTSSRTSTPSGRASATPPRTPTGTPALGRRSNSTLH